MGLSTEGLTFAYPESEPALKGLSLDFSRGHVVGVLGANGCGKSTLFMNLLGVLKPQRGQVCWQGSPIGYGKAALGQLRRRVAMVFQEPDQQIFYTDVVSDIAFALRNLGVEEAEISRRIDEALTLVDGQALRDKPVQYLSHGQKKRVAIAGALVMQADYLLLDEPTAGLDPTGRRQMIVLLDRILAQGKRVVISSHDIVLIYEVCDYLYVLERGELVAQGSAQQVLLDQAVLDRAGLVQPWLVKLHTELGLPLYPNEAALFAAQGRKLEAV